jgi:hypothetical protein
MWTLPGAFTATLDELIVTFNRGVPRAVLQTNINQPPISAVWDLIPAILLEVALANDIAETSPRSGPVVVGVAQATAVHEPSSLALLGLGLAGLGFGRRYRRRQTDTV